MTLSAVLITMVISFLVAQNDFFSFAVRSSEAHDRVRSVAEQIQAEFRAVSPASGKGKGSGDLDGIEVAQDDRILFRAPVAVGVVCRTQEGKGKGKGSGAAGGASVFLPLGAEEVDGDRISGYGVQPLSNGGWRYYSNGWAAILGSGGSPDSDCEEVGADLDAANGGFFLLEGSVPDNTEAGDLISLLTEVEFFFDDSALLPGTRALFRRVGEQDPVEFASGLAPDAAFQYRVGESPDWTDSVNPSGQRANIRAIRVVAEAALPGGGEGGSYGWVVELPLRNVP